MKSLRRMFLSLTALIGLLLSALPAAALITVVNDDNSTFTNVVPGLGSNVHTVSFDAGATADKLIVSLSSETGSGGPPVITYNGETLTQVPGTENGRSKGIWYLDNPYTGGPADLVIDMTGYAIVNGIGFGVVSVSGAAPGTTGGDAAGGLEVSVTTTDPGSLIVSGYGANNGGIPVVPSGHNQLYTSGDIGSADGAAAYRILNLVPAGVETITYTQASASGNSTSAAGFAPVVPTVAVVASASNGITVQTGNTNTITGFTVAPGDDRKLVLVASWENSNNGISATWNGTENFEVAINPLKPRNSVILYLDDPTPGTGDIVVTFPVNTGSRVGVLSLTGAVDGVSNTANSNGITGSVEVPVSGSLVVGVYTSNATPTFTNPPAFTNILYNGSSGSSFGNAGYQAEPAGLRTFTWTSTGGTDHNNSLAVFLPAAASPVIVSATPATGATDAPLGGDLVATFSEPVVAGSGNIELWQVGGGSPVESFDVTSSSQLTFSGQTLTINPTSDLTLGVEYYVLIPPTAIVDTSGGDAFAGITDPSTWSFGDTAPVIVSLSPADDATNVALDTNLVATFSESVVAGTGDIELWKVGGGSPVESFNAAVPAEVAFSGASFTINPGANLDPAADYYVIIPATAVVDLSAQAFAGIAGTAEWNFSAGGQTWDGGDVDGFWTSVLNWDGDVSPDFSKPITFVGDVRNGPNNDLTADTVVGGIHFANDGSSGNSNAFTLGGNRLTLGGDIATTASSGNIEDIINLDMILDGDRTFNIGSSHNLRVNNVLSEDASPRTLIKAGDGDLTLAGANTYTGATSISTGTLILGSANALGGSTPGVDGTSGISMANGSTLRTNQTNGAVTVHAPITTSGDVTINAPTTTTGVQTFNEFIVGGEIGGTGNVTFNNIVNDNTILTVTLNSANTYTGTTTIQNTAGAAGQMFVKLGIDDALPTTTVLNILGNAGVGSGRGIGLNLFGFNQTLAGLTNTASSLRVQEIVNSDVSAAATLTINGSTDTLYSGNLGRDTAGFSVNSNAIAGSTNGNNFALTKNGTGTFTLSGLNSFSGDVTVSGGTLVAAISGSGGNSALGGSLSAKTITVNTGGTLRFDVGNVFNNNFSSPASALPTLNIAGGTMTNGGTATNSALGNITLADGTLTYTTGSPVGTESGQGYGAWNLNGTVTSTGTSAISSGNAAIPVTLSADNGNGAITTFEVQSGTLTASAVLGEVTRAGNERVSGLIKTGPGTMVLSATNTYTGDTTVNAGVLALTGASIADTGKLVINGSGIVDLTNTETVAALDFDGTPQPAGNYSASGVPAGATITTASFSGAGTLTVGAAPSDAYTLWAATNAPTGTPADDFDGDGVNNAVEFVLGGLATTNDLDKLPTTAADGTDMTFTFDRAVASIDPKTVVTIEVSTDLVTWDTPPSPYAVPDTATGPVNPGVTVVEDTSPGFDTVTLTVPQDAAKKFARLNVVILP